ncbi:MAG: tRNA lysidine(34) synthetase TilS [Clostridia bacterium]|nr:tRNA lysidine(34) synthetase TilS [Clostridia bacterium]
MLEKIKQTVNKYHMISPGDRIIVAVSGGADSVALLYCLMDLASELGFQLYVVHVNHMLRGTEAEEDAGYVAELAEKHNLPCAIRRVDVGYLAKMMPTSKQDAARALRYGILEEEAANWGANKIALGHHADDQAETILLHLLRGTGLEGLVGMQPVRDGRYIRPLLEVTRQEIENYCSESNLKFRTDRSNLEPVYLRNRIRLELMPLLQREYNPALVRGLSRLANLAREESNFLTQEAGKAFEQVATVQNDERVVLDIAELSALPMALQRRVLIMAWKKVSGEHANLEFERVDEALDLAFHGLTGQGLELPRRVYLEKSYGALIVRLNLGHNGVDQEFAYLLPVPGKITVPELGLAVRAELMPCCPDDSNRSGSDTFRVFLDADKITSPLVVRNRRAGDRFYPLGAPGHKKLKDFFIDAKIPREFRQKALLVCSGEKIVWVAGVRLAEPYRISSGTGKILALTVEKP